ncbi:MAG: PorT family protein [Prevotellaceae bacterium]|nr:PorT family protein [Prevotellaceae bacterium]
MKKVLFMVAALACCVAMQAQIVSSRSSIVRTEKVKSNLTWFFKAGINFMNFSNDNLDTKLGVGYNVVAGFQDPISTNGAYWGMDLGFGSRGAKKMIAHNVQASPFTFGWKIGLNDNLKLDPHVGVYASYDIASHAKEHGDWQDLAYDYDEAPDFFPSYNKYDIGMNIGVGLWYDRFNVDLTYQRGFVDVITKFDGLKTSNVLLRVGVAF